MVSGVSKIKSKSAMPPKTRKAPILHNHVTTSKFCRPGIAFFKEMVPDHDEVFDLASVVKMEPLIHPYLGSANLNIHAFFVPYRTINAAYNDFIADAPHTWANNTASIVSTDRRVSTDALIQCFLQNAYSIQNSNPNDAYDFWYTGETSGRVFTEYGKNSYKLLCSLGYKLIPDDDVLQLNANPLLCAARVYLDWFYPGAYYPIDYVITLKAFLENNSSTSYDISNNAEGISVLNAIFGLWNHCFYGMDYFTSAFDSPTNTNIPSLGSNFTLKDQSDIKPTSSTYHRITNGVLGVNSNAYNTPIYTGSGTSVPLRITQYGLELLNSVSNYLRRHQLAGFRSIDRMLLRFGFTNTPDKFNRSVLVGQRSIHVDVSQVDSNSDTTGANLGAYAANARANTGEPLTFEFKNHSTDYGLFIITYNVMPDTGIVQGIRRMNLNVDKLDHWTPEFDGRGVDAIAKSELP